VLRIVGPRAMSCWSQVTINRPSSTLLITP